MVTKIVVGIALLVIGLLASYTDIKKGVIKNWAIAFGIVLALGLNLGYLSSFSISVWVTNALLTILVGFLLWEFGVWSAGDGKLFTVFGLMIPVFLYSPYTRLSYMPSFHIIMNTFIPISVFLLGNLLLVTTKKEKKHAAKKLLHPKMLLNTVLILFAFSWLFTFMGPLSFEIFLLITFGATILTSLFSIIPNSLQFSILGLLGVGRLLFDTTWRTQSFMVFFLGGVVVVLFLRFLLVELGGYAFSRRVQVKDLRKGMIPAEVIYESKEGMKRRSFSLGDIFHFVKGEKSFLGHRPEPLRSDDITAIQTLAKKHAKFTHFLVQDTLPFAPFLLAGALLTLFLGGDILTLIVPWFFY